MSVRGDFTHFRRNTGINFAPDRRIMETSKESPFDYKNHGMLYIPERMPFPNIRDGKYMEILMEEIKKIINATHGHTLILFTSYWLMERVFYGLKEEISGYPLFMMGKGRLDVISNFRKSGNGVLFASDSAGEGIDLAGDILSSLIVVKLPFPVPDPVMEYQSRHFDSNDYDGRTPDMDVPFQNLASDYYCEECSIKIKEGIKTVQNQGEYYSSEAPFGYQKVLAITVQN